jgi:putative Holliday junction resolvase
VVGLPFSMDGSIGAQAEGVLEFAGVLGQVTDIPVDTYDERLSTVEADRLMREAGTKRGKRKENLDALAAAVILQGYIDRMDT